MSNKPSDQDNFYDWMMASNTYDAWGISGNCECGVEATYKGKKDFDTTYMHSYYCPKYKEKPENGKQKETRE